MNKTIKIPVKVTVVEETIIEIETPCYVFSKSHFYFVPNGDMQCTQVFPHEWGLSIGLVNRDVAFHGGYELITKAEYDEQFEKALSILKGETL